MFVTLNDHNTVQHMQWRLLVDHRGGGRRENPTVLCTKVYKRFLNSVVALPVGTLHEVLRYDVRSALGAKAV